ncbi:unnamed protein product [Ambrosiozyma monospora]|uniref:Unnamed protein product n=1 Tax=Ambrosiozyma monospora TaxID=43982 RepID=A0ACB5TSV5_AMBMO|nr:unnamed protein product [Ambrosiozyma monospora]
MPRNSFLLPPKLKSLHLQHLNFMEYLNFTPCKGLDKLIVSTWASYPVTASHPNWKLIPDSITTIELDMTNISHNTQYIPPFGMMVPDRIKHANKQVSIHIKTIMGLLVVLHNYKDSRVKDFFKSTGKKTWYCLIKNYSSNVNIIPDPDPKIDMKSYAELLRTSLVTLRCAIERENKKKLGVEQ